MNHYGRDEWEITKEELDEADKVAPRAKQRQYRCPVCAIPTWAASSIRPDDGWLAKQENRQFRAKRGAAFRKRSSVSAPCY